MKNRLAATIASAVTLLALLASNLGEASAPAAWDGRERDLLSDARSPIPEDRYAMAGGCYALLGENGWYVVRDGEGWAARGESLASAEPFHFQATDLGIYLLFGAQKDFLAASEGAIAEAVYPAVRSTPGAIAGGVLLEQTDAAADQVARSQANRAAGRGARIVSASEPSPLADWEVEVTASGFSFVLNETGQRLGAGPDGTLIPSSLGADDTFLLELTDGCAAYPEVEVNVDGPILGGETDFQEVRGYMEAHLHMMAFEFIGGRVRCGRPWHRYGVAYALVDCPDHAPNGQGAILEQVLSGTGNHNTDGWPTFAGWPRHNSLTHEQIYYKWLERAWRGGLRMFTNLLVDNGQLCKVYPFKRNSCNEMDGVRLQAQRIRELERYIDAQSGGPGEGWFRIVTDPFQARRVINQGKLAVVLGIEVSVPLDCGLMLDVPACDLEQIDTRLDEIYDLGVRQMELVNKFDNALSGVTGDAGTTGIVVNQGNKSETGHYWRMETCTEEDGHAHDKRQMNINDDGSAPDQIFGRDALVGGILQLFGKSGAAPVYPEGPHCNTLGLSDLGEAMIKGMVERGMIFDPDHMSARARTEAVDLIESLGHSGIVSSHGWADDTIYPRVYELGGVVAPHAGTSTSFVEKWRKHKAWADPRYYFGLAYGADTNGFSTQGGPRGVNAPNKVTYPFAGFGGVTVHQQKSGTKTYDINREGVAHYGLYPDWVEDIRRLGGAEGAAIVDDLERGSEAYLQMWERSIGVAPDACRSDVDDLTDDDVASIENGMTPEQVLQAIGQPGERLPTTFEYCMTGGRSAAVTFSSSGSVTGVAIA